MKQGVVSNNRYDVFFYRSTGDIQSSKDLSLRCESLNIPGLQITTADYKLYGGQPILKIPNARVHDDVQITFLTMGDMRDKMFFENWMDSISDFSNNTIAYYNDISSNIEIDVYSDEGTPQQSAISSGIVGQVSAPVITTYKDVDVKPIYTVTLVKAIPTRIESIQVGWADYDTLLKYTVNFSYESLKFEKGSNRSGIVFKHLDKVQG
jgi:hypothetical protein